MAFGLRFLDGVGDAYDNNLHNINDLENKTKLDLEESDGNGNSNATIFSSANPTKNTNMEQETQNCQCANQCAKTNKWLKVGALLVAGGFLGQLIRHICCDGDKKQRKSKED